MTRQRIRDPLHDLIEFDDGELEQALWRAAQTRPFQRLRRVKQLGFSDAVYPGATHSRFAHSMGVFHTARLLMAVVRKTVQQPTKEQAALVAALFHDVGHGPFSHAFEAVGKRLGLKLANHEMMSDLLIRDSEISEVLKELGSGVPNDVADIIQKNGVKTVQHAVVSSQFDADRLDYMRRDRLMCGTQHAAIDFNWLIANLEIGSVPIGVDDTALGSLDTFVIGPKAMYAAEAFVLGLFQLYPTVYFHKTTRGIEKLFVELIIRVITSVLNGDFATTGLPESHPLVKFALHPEDPNAAMNLDDTVIWGALSLMSDAKDNLISEFSKRILDRTLFKCIDIRIIITHAIDPKGINSEEIILRIDKSCSDAREKITQLSKSIISSRILIDDSKRSPYKPTGESKGPLDRINIRTEGGSLVDLKERSSVVASLTTFKFLRVYVDRNDDASQVAVRQIVDGEIEACRKAL